MRFEFTPEQEKFREEVKAFLEKELTSGTFEVHCGPLVEGPSREFSRKMAEKGWIGLTWPKKYGGQGRSYVDKFILMEELLKVRAPISYHFAADRQVGPALIKFGSEWQREFFLPRIIKAKGDINFCLLFSEPNAGSDLVSVTTRAEKDGEYYVVNGQKVWTSGGHQAAYGWLLARTSFDEKIPRHAACSEFIFDMKAPGVTVRPIVDMVGRHSFNEVFIDNVRIHQKFLVGSENEGFKQIMAQVDHERAGLERLMQNYPVYQDLIKISCTDPHLKKDPEFYAWVKNAIADIEIEYNVGRLLCYYTAWLIDQGKQPSSQAALTKAFCTQLEQRINDLATQVLGPSSSIKGTPNSKPPLFINDLYESYLWGPSYTLQGGSVEVLKNIVALRGLKMPR